MLAPHGGQAMPVTSFSASCLTGPNQWFPDAGRSVAHGGILCVLRQHCPPGPSRLHLHAGHPARPAPISCPGSGPGARPCELSFRGWCGPWGGARWASRGEQAGALSQAPCEAARGARLLPQAWPPFISIPSCQHRAWRARPSPPLPFGPRSCPRPLGDPRPMEQAFAGSPTAVTLKRSLMSSTGNAGPRVIPTGKGPPALPCPCPHSWDPLGI